MDTTEEAVTLPLADAVEQVLRSGGTDLLTKPDLLHAYLLDLMATDDPDLRVLTRNLDEQLIAPYREAVEQLRSLEDAQARACDYLVHECLLDTAAARSVAVGLATGVSQWSGIPLVTDTPLVMRNSDSSSMPPQDVEVIWTPNGPTSQSTANLSRPPGQSSDELITTSRPGLDATTGTMPNDAPPPSAPASSAQQATSAKTEMVTLTGSKRMHGTVDGVRYKLVREVKRGNGPYHSLLLLENESKRTVSVTARVTRQYRKDLTSSIRAIGPRTRAFIGYVVATRDVDALSVESTSNLSPSSRLAWSTNQRKTKSDVQGTTSILIQQKGKQRVKIRRVDILSDGGNRVALSQSHKVTLDPDTNLRITLDLARETNFPKGYDVYVDGVCIPQRNALLARPMSSAKPAAPTSPKPSPKSQTQSSAVTRPIPQATDKATASDNSTGQKIAKVIYGIMLVPTVLCILFVISIILSFCSRL